jgi:hypothetical protein
MTFVCVQVQWEFTPKGGKGQGATMKHPRGPRHKDWISYEKTPYLNSGDDKAKKTQIMGQKSKMTRWATGRKGWQNEAKVGAGRSAQAGRPTPFWHRFDPPFLEHEDAWTLSCWRCCHSGGTQISTRTSTTRQRGWTGRELRRTHTRNIHLVQGGDHKRRRTSRHYHSAPRVEGRHCWESLPWSTTPCLLDSWWDKLLICPWGCKGSYHVITDSFVVSVYWLDVDDALTIRVSYHGFWVYRSHYYHSSLQHIVIIRSFAMIIFT